MELENNIPHNIVFSAEKNIPLYNLMELYTDAGWTSYTKHPETLLSGVQSSLYVYSAWDNNKLIGFIRVIGDDHTIIYIQDILVHSQYRRHGIGSALLNHIVQKYSHIRQIVLLTDAKDDTIQFYEKNGLKKTDTLSLTSFIRI